jgi:hypothetical protein
MLTLGLNVDFLAVVVEVDLVAVLRSGVVELMSLAWSADTALRHQ